MAQDVGTVYVQVEPSGKGFGKKIEGDITPSIDNIGSKGSTSIISKIGGAFTKIGKLGAATIGTVTGGIVALAAKGGFERALNIENAQAKLKGLGHDADSVQEIMNDALASVKGTAFGLGDAATVAASLSASGVQQGAQLTKVLKTVADTAQISGRSLTDIGTIFGSVAARGKLQGDDMLQLMSSGVPVLQLLGKHLNKTSADVSEMVSAGKIDFQTFADAMQEGLGGAALSAGTTFTGALANVKAALGRLGEKAAGPLLNGLRDMFNQAIPVIDGFTEKATPVLEQVGAGLQKGLTNAIPAVTAFFSWLGDAYHGVVDLFGKGEFTAAFRNAFKIEEDSPIVDFLLNLRNAIGNFIDSTSGLLSKLSGMGGGLTPLIGIFGVLGSTVVQNLPTVINLLADLVDKLSGVIGFVGDNSDWLLPLAGGITGLVAASKGLGAVSSGLAGIPKALSGMQKASDGVINFIKIMPELGGFGPALKSMAGGMSLVKNAQGAWNAVTTLTSTAWKALGAAISANPIGAIIVAITAVVSALTWFFTQTETGKAMWSNFIDWLQGAWQVVSGFFSGLWNGIVDIFNTAVSTVSNVIQSIASFVQPGLQAISSAWSNAWNAILALFNAVWNAISPIVMPIVAGIQSTITMAMTTIQTIWSVAWSAISGYFTTVWNMIAAFIGPAIQAVWTIIQTVLTVIQTVWSTIWNVILTVVQTVWNVISTVISTVLNVIAGIITAVTAAIQGDWSGAWNAILSVFSTIWNGIQSVASSVMNGISSIISTVLNGISGVWSSIWNGISSAFGSIWSGIKAAASAGVQGVVDTVTGIKDKIVGFFSGAGQWLADAGKNIISGLWNGISGAVSGLYDNIKGALTGLVDKAKSALGIHSPSTVFRDQVGVMIGRGTAVGIDRSRPFVSRSLNELADSLTLDGHEFGMDGMMPMVYGKSVTGRQSGYQQGSDQSLLDELRALHTDMLAIMEGMSIQLDGRVVGRVVRQYANV